MAALLAAIAALPVGARENAPSPARERQARLRLPATARQAGHEMVRGQHGRDLELLRTFHTSPEEGESNHYFDLWEPGSLSAFAQLQGLTNNRALLIDSHGTGRASWKGTQYLLRPNVSAIGSGQNVPVYSMADVAQVMGSEAAAGIHNIFIAGCNGGGYLKPSVIRRHFVNATNITYMAPGELSYKPVFYQALSVHSLDVRPLYGRPLPPEGESSGPRRMEIHRTRVAGSVPLGTYVAELYLPGASKPFRRQRAGRELLDPGFLPTAIPAQTSLR